MVVIYVFFSIQLCCLLWQSFNILIIWALYDLGVIDSFQIHSIFCYFVCLKCINVIIKCKIDTISLPRSSNLRKKSLRLFSDFSNTKATNSASRLQPKRTYLPFFRAFLKKKTPNIIVSSVKYSVKRP